MSGRGVTEERLTVTENSAQRRRRHRSDYLSVANTDSFKKSRRRASWRNLWALLPVENIRRPMPSTTPLEVCLARAAECAGQWSSPCPTSSRASQSGHRESFLLLWSVHQKTVKALFLRNLRSTVASAREKPQVGRACPWQMVRGL